MTVEGGTVTGGGPLAQEDKEGTSMLSSENSQSRLPSTPVVKMDSSLEAWITSSPTKHLGRVLYTGASFIHHPSSPIAPSAHLSNQSIMPISCSAENLDLFLLPEFDASHFGGTMDVYIPHCFLFPSTNPAVRCSAVWGTDVYTDDSDIVAILAHTNGHASVRLDGGNNLPSSLPSSSPPPSSTIVADTIIPLLADQRSKQGSQPPSFVDLKVTIQVLPKLKRYTGSTRFGVTSRGWGIGHDGESIRVVSVEELPVGQAIAWARKSVNMDHSQHHLASSAPVQQAAPVLSKHVFYAHEQHQFMYKYSPSAFIEWPIYLRHQKGATPTLSAGNSGSGSVTSPSDQLRASTRHEWNPYLDIPSGLLNTMGEGPFWQVLLEHFNRVEFYCQRPAMQEYQGQVIAPPAEAGQEIYVYTLSLHYSQGRPVGKLGFLMDRDAMSFHAYPEVDLGGIAFLPEGVIYGSGSSKNRSILLTPFAFAWVKQQSTEN